MNGSRMQTELNANAGDQELFGWDPTPGIVSVWAYPTGKAVIWRRTGEEIVCENERFCPWILATTLTDLGPTVQPTLINNNYHAAITHRELDGPVGWYRYLISATDERYLVRTLLNGASRRLGYPVKSLASLNEYYRVGLVEQYLMSTGRVYFRGLAYSDLHRMQFDLETTALDPAQGRIFMVAVRDSRGLALTLEAPAASDERQLILDLCALIRDRDPDVLENHNLFGFDLPFLVQRAAILGIPLMLGRAGGPSQLEAYANRRHKRYRVAGRELLDTLDAVLRHAFVTGDLSEYGLKAVARYFGVAASERTYLEGAEVYSTYRRDPDTVRHYALDDVAEVDALSQRLLAAPFALAQMAPRRYEQLSSAGPAMGILEPMLVRAYLRAGAAVPCQSEQVSGRHTGGALYLFATGIAEHVVKADIASLYPSLMRTYRIGPACDRLGVLLRIVSRLTDLRLSHKAAARAAMPGSLEAGHHAAMQAAMKLLINSAYGYLGAGRMALFADRAAADEVTRRGREILTRVVEALRARGMLLIEADTDGVYFAVPCESTEAWERALVAQVGAELPEGIHLEYAGRYRAMFSHEVKNYALLTYDNELIVRGVALRSSRSEPFGERFLLQALRSLMCGDMIELQQIFQQMVAAIQERALPVSDFATRARLSKSPQEYLSTRTRQREAPYEALLAAGRNEWASGERIRFYRNRDQAAVLLPDTTQASGVTVVEEGASDPRDYDIEHYLRVLVNTYADQLRKAFAPDDWEQIFRLDGQTSMWDKPVEQITPVRIRY